jgi:ABC-2 type transport system ATP-binding protein
MAVPVDVEGLVKRYGDRTAVDGLTFAVAEGEVFALLGPNGAGKTSTVEILEGFRTADGGHARVLGLDPRSDRRRLTRSVGVMLQEGGAYPSARVREVVRLFSSYYDDPLPASDLGLDHIADRYVKRLSGGEKQQLGLALALIGRPRLVFLDEPTAGMDPRVRADTWERIRRLRTDGVTVLMTTHYMDEAERLADRVAIVDRGRLVALDTPAGLVRAARSFRFRAAGGLDVAALTAAIGVPVAEASPGDYTIDAPSSPALVARLTAWLAERDLALESLSSGSLEEVFLDLTQNGDP